MNREGLNTSAGWLARVHNALNHDFCPSANRWVYWLKHPFWILVAAAIAAILCGLFVSTAALLLGVGLIVVLVIGGVWPWVGLRGISGSIRFDQERCRLGEPVEVTAEVWNQWPWPVWGLEVSRGLFQMQSADRLLLKGVAGWSRMRTSWLFRPDHRGIYPFETPRLESGFPFGLYRAFRPLEPRNELIVWPERVLLNSLPDAVEIEAREDRTSSRRAGDVGDILGTRRFRQGDPLRRVHWAQSARQGHLVVCERQLPASCAVRIVLDVNRDHHGLAGEAGTLERLIKVAASLVDSLHANHALVEIQIGEQMQIVGNSRHELRSCMDVLARIPRDGITHSHCDDPCCHSRSQHRAMPEFILTTPKGFAALQHSRHWSDNHRYIVIGGTGDSAPIVSHACGCRVWIEIPAEKHVLDELRRQWKRACRDN